MLHLGILVENMRREGFEFQIGPPKVIMKKGENGKKLEPFDEATVDVPEEHVGPCVDLLGSRKGVMQDMVTANVCFPSQSPETRSLIATVFLGLPVQAQLLPCNTGTRIQLSVYLTRLLCTSELYSSLVQGQCRVKYLVPTRGLLGLKNSLLSATKGNAVLNTQFVEYGEYLGEFSTRENGSLVAFETGQVTAYALASAQERGVLMCKPGDQVYEGQVCGVHQRGGDLKINVCKKKALTNMRASGKDKYASSLLASRLHAINGFIPYSTSLLSVAWRAAGRLSSCNEWCSELHTSASDITGRLQEIWGPHGLPYTHTCALVQFPSLTHTSWFLCVHPLSVPLFAHTCSASTGPMRVWVCSTVALDGTKEMSLDDCLEYVIDDELVEVTPVSVRMRKNPDIVNKKGKRN